MTKLLFPESERYPGFSEARLVMKSDYSTSQLLEFRNSLVMNFTFLDDVGGAYFLDVYIHMNKSVPPSLFIMRGEDNKEYRFSLCRNKGLLSLERKE